MLRIMLSPARSVLVGALIVTSGCCAHRFSRPEGPTPDGTELVKRMQSSTGKVRSFDYRTRSELYSEQGVLKGKVDVLGKRDAQLYFEAMTPTDDTVAILSCRGGRFMSHERGRSECYVGDACPENVSRLLPLEFECDQVLEILVGGAPLILYDAAQAEWDDCEGTYRLTLRRKTDDVTLTVWLRPDTYTPVKVRGARAGKELFTITYNDFKSVSGVLLPHKIRFISPQREADLLVRIRDPELNKLEDDSVFKVTCPKGTSPTELKCP